MLRNINKIFNRQFQVSLHQSVRTFSLASARYSDDGDGQFKNDPDVKKILSKIQEDFKPPDKTELTEEPTKTVNPKSSKNVSDILSELYGSADSTGESKDDDKNQKKVSSVGEILTKCGLSLIK